MSNSLHRSRGAFLRPGFATLLRSPESRVGGAPRVVRVLGGTPVRRAHNAARQAPSEAPCVPSRGTLASRRSTVAVFHPGPRFHLRHDPDPYSELLAARS